MKELVSSVVFITAALLLFGIVKAVAGFVHHIVKKRHARLGDEVDHNEWRFGSPDRHIPENAVEVDLHLVIHTERVIESDK